MKTRLDELKLSDRPTVWQAYERLVDFVVMKNPLGIEAELDTINRQCTPKAKQAAAQVVATLEPPPAAPPSPDYSAMSSKELKALAKERGVKGRGRMSREELIKALD